MFKIIFSLFLLFPSLLAYTQNSIEELIIKLEKTEGNDQIIVKQKLAAEYRYKLPILSEKYARESIIQAHEIKDTLLLIKGYRLLGGAKEFQSQYDSSVYYFQLSKNLAEKIDDAKEQAIANSNLAFIYIHSEDYLTAIRILKTSIPSFITNKDSTNLALIYNNIGTCFFKLNELDSALLYLKQASSIKERQYNKTSFAISLLNIADVYTRQMKFDKAYALLSKSLDIFEDENSIYNIAYTNILLADLFKHQKQKEKEALYLKLALENANKIKSFQLKSDIYKRLSKVYIEKEQYKKGYHFLILHKNIEDSLQQVANNEMVNELKVVYEFDLLQEELELTENELKLESSRNFFLVSFLCILSLFLLILFIQYKKIKTKNILLVQQRLSSRVEDSKTEEHLPEDLINLYNQIVILMKEKELYINSTLNIHDLAKTLNSNTTYVSKAINSCAKKNFKSFINEFRVNKAIELLSENKQEEYTMAAISDMSGFTSVSVFNRSFKEIVGVTPSFFAKKSKNK